MFHSFTVGGCYVRLAHSADRLCARPRAFRGWVHSLAFSLCKHSMRVPAVKDLIIHEEDPDTFCLANGFHLIRYAAYMFSVIIPQT